jgi:hypothetical protein
VPRSAARRLQLIGEAGRRRLRAAVPLLLRILRLLSAVEPAPEAVAGIEALAAVRDAAVTLLSEIAPA